VQNGIMLDDLLTEAAQRALDAAARLAQAAGAAETRPLHLLWALALDESQAAEVLKAAGISPDALHQTAPLGPAINDPKRLLENQSQPEARLPDSDDLRRVVADAVRRGPAARRQGVGTEHLLDSLLSIDASLDVVREAVATHRQSTNHEATPAPLEEQPLEVEINIRWRDAGGEPTADLRIIDAAANRAREGLRVAEDYARFALDDGHLVGRLKDCRHALRRALDRIAPLDLIRARDTRTDVGTRITTAAASLRSGAADVARAAFKRAQEGVRSLEEFGKLHSPEAARELERIRYDLYTLEKALVLAEANRRTLSDVHVYLLATESLCQDRFEAAVRGAIAGGVKLVQLREKGLPDRRLIERAGEVRLWTREAGIRLIINDRPDVAVAVQADGVHLGQDDMTVRQARCIVGPQRWIGVSTHTIEQAREAALDGADYLGVGPVFPSTTKRFEGPAGLEFVRQTAAEISLPWFAIGGIHAGNIDEVIAAGACRVAVSNAICGAADPADAARTLAQRLWSAAEKLADSQGL
jgi:thiamine-phosphate pyrophosphorylase